MLKKRCIIAENGILVNADDSYFGVTLCSGDSDCEEYSGNLPSEYEGKEMFCGK
jgi:hypothetical protein